MEKLSNQQYKFVCELIWGHVPIDRIWAEESSLFKEKVTKLLLQFPYLDKSFFGYKDPMSYEVFDTWNKKVTYTGTKEGAESFIKGNNIYQMNYSKLVMRQKSLFETIGVKLTKEELDSERQSCKPHLVP